MFGLKVKWARRLLIKALLLYEEWSRHPLVSDQCELCVTMSSIPVEEERPIAALFRDQPLQREPCPS